MFWIEIGISLFNVAAVWLTTHRYFLVGCISGAVGQIGWVWMFVYTNQYGIIPMEILLASIYIKHIYKYLRKKKNVYQG